MTQSISIYADVNLSFVIRIILILTHTRAHTVLLWVKLASATNIECINGKQWAMLVQRSWVMMWKSENTMSFGNLLIWKLIEFLVFHEMMNCKKPKFLYTVISDILSCCTNLQADCYFHRAYTHTDTIIFARYRQIHSRDRAKWRRENERKKRNFWSGKNEINLINNKFSVENVRS